MTKAAVTNLSKSIGKLLEMVDRGQLLLPEMQRDFVWTRKSIKLLIDSLYRGLPIGHMLIWKATQAVNQKAFANKKIKPGVVIDGFYGYLLDGQQRLTALAQLRDGNEDYPLMFYVWPEREADGDETFYWRRKNDEDDPWRIPLSEILSPDFSVAERMSAIKADIYYKPDQEEIIRSDIFALQRIVDYTVGVTEFETDEYRLAAELFIRFNSTGRKLHRSDLSIAELALHVPGLVTSEIARLQGRWPGFRFTMPFLVQCLIAVHTRRYRLTDPEGFWTEFSPHEISQSWKITEKALGKLIEFLTGTVHWTSTALVPSFNALIPLTVMLAHGAGWSSGERRIVRRWLLLSGVHAYFSGSAATVLDKVLRAIESDPSPSKLWSTTKGKLRKLRADDFVTGRISGSVMSMYISMLRDKNAKDWQDVDRALDGTVIGRGATLQIHHFFPKALLNKRKELKYADINTFANYTLLSASANLDVSTEEPSSYIERLNVPSGELAKQCIPVKSELWRAAKYSEFLIQRRKFLAEQCNLYLGV